MGDYPLICVEKLMRSRGNLLALPSSSSFLWQNASIHPAAEYDWISSWFVWEEKEEELLRSFLPSSLPIRPATDRPTSRNPISGAHLSLPRFSSRPNQSLPLISLYLRRTGKVNSLFSHPQHERALLRLLVGCTSLYNISHIAR